MILAAHAITGAAVASLMPERPLIGFAVGFLSHFLLDAIPHWDYHLDSMREEKDNPMNNDIIINVKFFGDLLKISLDGMMGLLLAYLIFGFFMENSVVAILCGAIGAMTPDALQFAYMKWRHEPLSSLQRFHLWIHAKKLNARS
jgi:hypothetical protein